MNYGYVGQNQREDTGRNKQQRYDESGNRQTAWCDQSNGVVLCPWQKDARARYLCQSMRGAGRRPCRIALHQR